MTKLSNMTEPQLAELFNEIARAVDFRLPQRTLFVVLAFDDPGLAQYVSNANRKDIVKALRESADRLEGMDDIMRNHERK